MMNDFKRPLAWAVTYVGVIFVFAIIYLFITDRWGGCEPMNGFVDSFYFSVVTITTLGFGDTYPTSGSPERILVSTEAILGILILGFFLNDIALSQSKLLDKRNKEKEDEKKAENALNKLMIYRQILLPVFERYLRGAYMMVTPMKDRLKMPQDIFQHHFNFSFNDMADLYDQSFLMSNDIYEPAVNAHFKNQDITYDELRSFVTSSDLSYWPDLEEKVYHFIMNHHQFQFQDVIMNNGLRPMGDGSNLGNNVREMMLNAKEVPPFTSGNLISPYVALYHYTKDNVATIQKIYGLMREAIGEGKES